MLWSLARQTLAKPLALTFWPCRWPGCTKSKSKTKFFSPDSEISRDTLSILNPYQWVNFMVKSMKWLRNGMMDLLLQLWGNAHKKKIPSQIIGSFLMDLSMLFGSKIWTLSLTITWCFASPMVKESSLLLPWECCLKLWILRSRHLPPYQDAEWFTWSVKTFHGNPSFNRHLMLGAKKWNNLIKMTITGQLTLNLT